MNFEIIPNLHPLAVHFPIALIAVALIFLAGARIGGSRAWAPQWAVVGHWALWLAALSAVVAAGLGRQAFNSVDHDDAGHVAMLLHRGWALPTAAGLVIAAAWDLWRHRAAQVPGIPLLLVAALLLGAVGTTAWLGGELVYRHRLGVLTLPQDNAEMGGNNTATAGASDLQSAAPDQTINPSTASPSRPRTAVRKAHEHKHDHLHDHAGPETNRPSQ